jgi:hypothetical protein
VNDCAAVIDTRAAGGPGTGGARHYAQAVSSTCVDGRQTQVISHGYSGIRSCGIGRSATVPADEGITRVGIGTDVDDGS